MNLKQMTHFLKLKKAHAYEIALSKPAIGQISDEDMYESLCLLDLSESLTDAINSFMDEYECTHPGEDAVCLLTAISFLLDGVIRMESSVQEDRKDIKILFDSMYDSISKGKDDEN